MNKDESWNFPQDYDPEMIKEEKRKELELEIRVQVCLHLPPVEKKPFAATITLFTISKLISSPRTQGDTRHMKSSKSSVCTLHFLLG